MKQYLMITGLMVICTIITFAQQKADPRDRAIHQAEKMKVALTLSDAQYDAIKAINETYTAKQAELRKDSAVSKEARYSRAKSLHQEREVAIRKQLTEEQNKKWTAQRSTYAHKARSKHGQSDRATRMKENLSLTDEQASKLKEINKEFATQFRSVKSDSTLAREDSRKRMHELREDHRIRTKAILTDEQCQKWEALKEDRKRRKL